MAAPCESRAAVDPEIVAVHVDPGPEGAQAGRHAGDPIGLLVAQLAGAADRGRAVGQGRGEAQDRDLVDGRGHVLAATGRCRAGSDERTVTSASGSPIPSSGPVVRSFLEVRAHAGQQVQRRRGGSGSRRHRAGSARHPGGSRPRPARTPPRRRRLGRVRRSPAPPSLLVPSRPPRRPGRSRWSRPPHGPEASVPCDRASPPTRGPSSTPRPAARRAGSPTSPVRSGPASRSRSPGAGCDRSRSGEAGCRHRVPGVRPPWLAGVR